jgi:hypothetical protein
MDTVYDPTWVEMVIVSKESKPVRTYELVPAE